MLTTIASRDPGFGRYNFGLLSTCCLLILAMYLDIFGLSVVLPAAACDLKLTATQQATLSAIPLIGMSLIVVALIYLQGLKVCCLLLWVTCILGTGHAGFLALVRALPSLSFLLIVG